MADREFLDALRANAGDVLADLCPIEVVYRCVDNDAAMGVTLWRKAADLGWLMLAIPEAHGGMGGGVAELAVLQEALGARVAPVPFLGTVLLADALASWPARSVAEALLPALAAGEIIGGVADPNGAPALSLTGRAGGPTLDGNAVVVDGGAADWMLVRFRDDDGEGLALLSAKSPGADRVRRPTADRTRTLVTLSCNSTPIEPVNIVRGGQAEAMIGRLRHVAGLLLASDALGGAEAIFAETIEYLKTRVQFGKPIGSFQALKHRAADLKVKLEMARMLVSGAIDREEGGEAAIWTPMAKFSACDAYHAIAAEAVQMHGGIGFTWEHRAHLYLKRAVSDRALFGDAASQQDRVAEALIEEYAS